MWLKKLIAAFIKQNGRKPNAIETIQLKFRANDMANKGKFLQFPPGGKGGKGPNRIMDELVDEQGNYIGDRKPGVDREGNFVEDIREFTRREDLYEGLPSALRNVKNPEEVKKLLDSGDIKIGTAPKTTKKKPAVDPKFKRAVESQDEHARLIKAFEARNKDSAFNFAFKKYKDIDRKPMELDEVLSIYTNLNKYPKGRSIIFGDIGEIQRGHILPNIGKRSREDLVSKLNKMVVTKKQPNPFKDAPDLKEGEQIEMDFIDWDPKGMAGGGLAYMLGEPSRTPYRGGGPSDWGDEAKGTGAYSSPTSGGNSVPDRGGDHGQFQRRIDHTAASKQMAEREARGPLDNLRQSSINKFVNRNKYKNLIDAGVYQNHPGMMTKLLGYMNPPDEVGMYDEDDIRTLYKGGANPEGLAGLRKDFEFEEKFSNPTQKQFEDYYGLNKPTDTGGGNEIVPPWLRKQQPSSLGIEGIAPKDDFDLYAVVEGREPSRFYADGGRIGFNKGGFNKGRRNFMKLMAGLASIPVVGKLFKGAKVASKIAPLKNTTTTMPAWFPDFVQKHMNNSISKKIDADLIEYKNPDLPNVKVTKHDDGRIVVDGNNEYNEGWQIDYTPPGYEMVDFKTGKSVKTKGEFEAVEGRHVALSPEDYDTDPFWVDDLDELTTIDVAAMEKYTTGKVTKTVKDAFGKDTGLKKGQRNYDMAVGRAENEADVLRDADLLDKDFAKGGLAHMLGE